MKAVLMIPVACVAAMVLMSSDGHAYVSESGPMRVPIAFDNLIAAGEMPPTAGVSINPGHRGSDGPLADRWGAQNNRSLEYHSLGTARRRLWRTERPTAR